MMDGLRKKFIDFFIKSGHTHLPSASLVLKDDPSLMFVNAGMVPFKEYFADVRKAPFSSIVTAQKCVRAGGKHNDLENVGFTKRHHTFFEMLGNFSFGCYFKERAIELAWKFVTEELKLSKEKLYVTVYYKDDEAFEIWNKLTGFGERKIKRISTSDNFWQMGDVGPCGPCSEIFYDHGEHLSGDVPGDNKDPGERYVEIWNLVFMQYIKEQSGELARMECPCVDTGMGLERVTAILEGTDDNYKTELFRAIVKESQKITGGKDNQAAHKVIADHLRSASFLIADGVLPGNSGHEYVLRRIIRRAVRYSHALGFDTVLLPKLFWVLEKYMGSYYQELTRAKNLVLDTLMLEEESFRNTLKSGMKLLGEVSGSMKEGDTLSGDIAFTLYDTHGFPLDITVDILKERKISVDEERFAERMKMQRLLAQTSRTHDTTQASSDEIKTVFLERGKTSFIGYENFTALALILTITKKDGSNKLIIVLDKTIFYPESGGQEGDQGIMEGENATLRVERVYKSTEGIILHECKIVAGRALRKGEQVSLKIDINRRNNLARNHSATHILHHVLRKRLGAHVSQRGSLVTSNRLRFDFSHSQSITEEELSKIEEGVNLMVWDDHPVITEIRNTDDAIRDGAIGLFGEKYDDTVRVVSIGEAVELCGGTHVKKSSTIGLVKILSASSVAHGVRRIEAVTHLTALQHIREENQAQLYQLTDHQAKLRAMRKSHQKEITRVYQSIVANAEARIEKHGPVEIVVKNIRGVSREILLSLTSVIRPQTGILVIHAELGEVPCSFIVPDKEICKNIGFMDSARKTIGRSHGEIVPSAPYVIQATFPGKEALDNYLKNLSKLVASAF